MVTFPDEAEVRVWSKDGERRHVPSKRRTAIAYSDDDSGGFGEFSLALAGPVSDWLALSISDRVDIWQNGKCVYRGFVSSVGPDGDGTGTIVTGYGRILELSRIVVLGRMLYPANTDASVAFATFADDYIVPRGLAQVAVVETIGVTIAGAGPTGDEPMTLADVMSQIAELCGGRAAWGFDVDESGQDRFWVRRTTAYAVDAILVPGNDVTAYSGDTNGADIVNRLTVLGGALRFPNLLKNASFERVVRNDGTSGNLIRNGSFEDGSFTAGDGGTNEWTLYNGASIRARGEESREPYDGQFMLLCDNAVEYFEQFRDEAGLITPGKTYRLATMCRPQSGVTASAALEIRWGIAGGAIIVAGPDGSGLDYLDIQCVSGEWERFEGDFTAPANVVSMRLVAQGGIGSDIFFDRIAFYDVDAIVSEGWEVVPGGTGEAATVWNRAGAKHGSYCVEVDAVASDADANDVVLRPLERVAIAGGQELVFFGWYQANGTAPKGRLELAFFKGDGTATATGAVQNYAFSHDFSVTAWTTQGFRVTAPVDAAFVLPRIRMRSTAIWKWDAMTLRDARAWQGVPGAIATVASYIAGATLRATFAASDVVTLAENANVHNSETTYGVREGLEQASEVIDEDSARELARAVFLTRAVPERRPTVTIVGARRVIPGTSVRLIGTDGPTLGGGIDLPVRKVRVTIAASGRTVSVDMGRKRPDLAQLIRQVVKGQR